MPTATVPLSGTTLFTLSPNNNYGGWVFWYANFANGSTVIRWDPSQVPVGKITAASLNIHLNMQQPSFNPSTQLSVYKLLPTSNWVVGSVFAAVQAGSACWNYEQYNTLAWASGAFSFTSDTDVLDSRSPVTQLLTTGWNTINIPADWIRTYNGVVIQSNQTGTDTYFDSQNATSNQPYLSVTYDPTLPTRSFLAHTYDSNGWCQANPWQRKTFFAAGLYWVFYSSPTSSVGANPSISYQTSPDGCTWSVPTIMRVISGSYEFDGDVITFVVNGTDIHYVVGEGAGPSAPNGAYYRKGTLNSNGTITWAANEQTILTVGSDEAYIWMDLHLDSNGYPWFGASHSGPGLGGFNAPWDRVVYKSTTKDGTWNTDTANGFPHSFGGFSTDTPDSNQPWVAMHGCALLNGDMLWMWPNRDGSSTAYKWNGTSLTWGPTETISGMQVSVPLFQYNGVAQFVGQSPGGNGLSYVQRSTSGVWSTPSQIVSQSSVGYYNITAMDIGSGRLRIFWARDPAVNNEIWFIDVNQYGVALDSPAVLVDESVEKISIGQTSLQVLPTLNGRNTLLTYTTLSAAPFNLRASFDTGNTLPKTPIPIMLNSYRRRR